MKTSISSKVDLPHPDQGDLLAHRDLQIRHAQAKGDTFGFTGIDHVTQVIEKRPPARRFRRGLGAHVV
jgi:hypothetical protein